MDPSHAERLARGWIDAFNRHDLDAVVAHYTDDVEFSSPYIPEVLGEPSATIRGRDAVRAYFQRALATYPNLAFELLHVLPGVDSVALVYRSLHRDRIGAEVMTLDAAGRICRVAVHYEA